MGFETKRHYYALDRADVRKLRNIVDRALRKEAVLVESLETLGVSLIDPGSGIQFVEEEEDR